jgi:hypothetical protein
MTQAQRLNNQYGLTSVYGKHRIDVNPYYNNCNTRLYG